MAASSVWRTRLLLPSRTSQMPAVFGVATMVVRDRASMARLLSCPKKCPKKLHRPGLHAAIASFFAGMLPIPQPRGRPRKDCYWCTRS
eukprot:7093718-Prymnesium_polylepis.1